MSRVTDPTTPLFARPYLDGSAPLDYDMRQDHSSSAAYYVIEQQDTEISTVNRLIFSLTGGGSSEADFLGKFAGASLTNGVSLLIIDADSFGVINELFGDEVTVGSVSDVFPYTSQAVTITNLGASVYNAHFVIEFEQGITIDDTQRLAIKLNDNFTVGTTSISVVASGSIA